MRFNLDKLENAGIKVKLDEVTGILDIHGTQETDDRLIEAYQDLTKAVANYMPHIKGFEAERLVDSFAGKLQDTSLLNGLKDLQEDY